MTAPASNSTLYGFPLTPNAQNMLETFLEEIGFDAFGVNEWGVRGPESPEDPSAVVSVDAFILRSDHNDQCTCGRDSEEDVFCLAHFHKISCYRSAFRRECVALGVSEKSDLEFSEKMDRRAEIAEHLALSFGFPSEMASNPCTCGRDGVVAAWEAKNPHDPGCLKFLPHFEHHGSGVKLQFPRYGASCGRANIPVSNETMKSVLEDCLIELGPFYESGRPDFNIHGQITQVRKTRDGNNLITVEANGRRTKIFVDISRPPKYIDPRLLTEGRHISIAAIAGEIDLQARILRPLN